jgi:hypothetical protein
MEIRQINSPNPEKRRFRASQNEIESISKELAIKTLDKQQARINLHFSIIGK